MSNMNCREDSPQRVVTLLHLLLIAFLYGTDLVVYVVHQNYPANSGHGRSHSPAPLLGKWVCTPFPIKTATVMYFH